MVMKEPRVIWFQTSAGVHHAFEVFEDGTIDTESCCGDIQLDDCADEPARVLSEFDTAPAHSTCLAVAEMSLPPSNGDC